MKTVVNCPNCNDQEYWGMLHWRDGRMYCRHCIERIWVSEQPNLEYGKCFKHYFPYYEDGIDYSKGVPIVDKIKHQKEKREVKNEEKK